MKISLSLIQRTWSLLYSRWQNTSKSVFECRACCQCLKRLSSNCVLLSAMSCSVEDRIYCKCKGINVKGNFACVWAQYICMHAQRVRHCTDISVFTPWCSILMMAKIIMLIDISRYIKMYFNRQLIPISLLSHLHWGRWLVSFYLFAVFIFMGSPPAPPIFPLCSAFL